MKTNTATSFQFSASLTRRRLLGVGALVTASCALSSLGGALRAFADSSIQLPFEMARPTLPAFPQKRSLIFSEAAAIAGNSDGVFEKGVFTPNDAFYVRWHLGSIPDEIDVTSFRLKIHGEVINPLELSLEQLQHDFEPYN